MAHIGLLKRRVVTMKRKSLSIFEGVSPPITINHTGSWAKKKQKPFHLWHNRVDYPLVDTNNQKFISSLNL